VKVALRIPIAGGEAEFTRWGFRRILVERAIEEDRRYGQCLWGARQPACVGNRCRSGGLAAAHCYALRVGLAEMLRRLFETVLQRCIGSKVVFSDRATRCSINATGMMQILEIRRSLTAR
jgi:hypothetical protein